MDLNDGVLSVKDKVVIVTGGAGILGGSMAGYLAKNGAKVVIMGRTQGSVDKKVSEIASEGGLALGISADVLDEKGLQGASEKVLDHWGQIDCLVNAAGGHVPGTTTTESQTVFDLPFDNLRETLNVNLLGSVLPSLVFGKIMAKQKFGSIINISSMAASHSITRVLGYSLAKSGIDILTKWMAMELAQKFGDGIRVNAVAPGFFLGNQNRKMLVNDDGTFTDRGQKIIHKTPMGRFGKADEINGLILYLCSDASKFVTGTVIPVDGGFSSFSGV